MTQAESRLVYGPGDLVVLYSDRITEAVDAKDEEFGIDSRASSVSTRPAHRSCLLGPDPSRGRELHAGRAAVRRPDGPRRPPDLNPRGAPARVRAPGGIPDSGLAGAARRPLECLLVRTSRAPRAARWRIGSVAALLGGLLGTGCPGSTGGPDPTADARAGMVDRQIVARGVKDERVLAVSGRGHAAPLRPAGPGGAGVRRPPLPIGSGQTISQPYVVAFMSEQLRLTGTEGPGESGPIRLHQTTLLASCTASSRSRSGRRLAEQTAARLKEFGAENVELRAGDGYFGWPEETPSTRSS